MMHEPIVAVGATDDGPLAVTRQGTLLSGSDPGRRGRSLPIPAVWPTLHRVEVLANGRWIVAVAGTDSVAHGILAWPVTGARPPLRIEVLDPDLGLDASQSEIASIEGGQSSVLVHDLERGTAQRFDVSTSLRFPALTMAANWIGCISRAGAVALLDRVDGGVIASGSSTIADRDVEAVVASADGSRFAAARTGSTQVELWTTNPLTPTVLASIHSASVAHLAFSTHGSRLASASSAEVIVHDIDAPTRAHRIAGTGPLAFSRDSSVLYLCAPDGSLRIEQVTSAT